MQAGVFEQKVGGLDAYLATPNAIARLKRLLEDAGWKGRDQIMLGSISHSAKEIEATSQINYAALGSTLDTLDDMYGALGQATVKIGIVGRTFSKTDAATNALKNYFRVEHLGFHLRDSYDFNGWQFLGIWTDDRVMKKSESPVALISAETSIQSATRGAKAIVTNQDFQDYRQKIGQGGDFIIYSDVLWKKSDIIIPLDA